MSQEPLEELKELVVINCGLNLLKTDDCKLISERIFEKDKNYLSENTIKSIFGFSKCQVIYTKFIYDTLSQFAGYPCYDQFKSCHFARQNELTLNQNKPSIDQESTQTHLVINPICPKK